MTEQEITDFLTKNPQSDLSDVMAHIDYSETYPNLAGLLVQMKIAKKGEFERELAAGKRRKKIADMLGMVPQTPHDLVEAVFTTTDFTIDAEQPHPLSWISPLQHRRVRLDMDELMEHATQLNRNLLGGQFHKNSVVDEIGYREKSFAQIIRTDTLAKLSGEVVPFDWRALVASSFDTTTISADITIAVLKKFIWQVKRRLDSRTVTYHLMPILYGSQGCGKSVFITKMLEQLGSLASTTDFDRLGDNREAGLFRNFALFLDEMNKADRADMDTVKAVITREEFSYRPMGTNLTVTSTQNASFIGASNKLLEQLINDPTGVRRFFQLDFNSQSGEREFAFINSLDFTAMWRSVDHLAADPCEPYRDEMRALQARHATRTSVGEFADALVENSGRYKAVTDYGSVAEQTMETSVVTKERVYLAYRDWCSAMRKAKPLEQQSFINELRRMSAQEPDFPLVQRKTNRFNGWVYTGPIAEATKVGHFIENTAEFRARVTS
jgi:hypothetical protein